MDIKLHKQATKTPQNRAEIQATPTSNGDAVSAIRRWRYRDDAYDLPHTRHNLLATITTEQEEVLIAVREFLRLSLDDLLVVERRRRQPPVCAGLARSASTKNSRR